MGPIGGVYIDNGLFAGTFVSLLIDLILLESSRPNLQRGFTSTSDES